MLEAAPYASIENEPGSPQGAAASRVQRVLLEVKLIWGGDVIALRHVRPSAQVTIRDVGPDVPGAPGLVIAREEAGAFVLCLPNGQSVPAGCRMTLRMGRVLLRVSLVADDADALPSVRPDSRVALGIIGAAVLHLVTLGLVAHGRAPEGAQDQEAVETMQRMIRSAEDRALAELATAKERPADESAAVPVPTPDAKRAALGSTPAKERGAAGNPSRATTAMAPVTRRWRRSGSSLFWPGPRGATEPAAPHSRSTPAPPRWATSSARPFTMPKAWAGSV
jgi:hypothetical protein